MSDTKKKTERKQFKLECVRLSYPNLFTPRAMESDDGGPEKKPEYSASFILDKKKHAAIIKEIEAEAKKVAIAKWGKVPGKFRGPVRDGSTFEDDDGNPKDGYGDAVVAINAKSRTKQQCVMRDLSAADEESLYGGCYVNVVITLYPWQHKANGHGVSANLGPVQFVKNGEPFGSRVIPADDAFEDLGEDDDGEDEKPAPKKGAGKKKPRPADDYDDPTAGL